MNYPRLTEKRQGGARVLEGANPTPAGMKHRLGHLTCGGAGRINQFLFPRAHVAHLPSNAASDGWRVAQLGRGFGPGSFYSISQRR